MSDIKEKYKIKKSPIQEAYERQIILKLNKEYEENVNKAYITIVEYFRKKYPTVSIYVPKAREKSPKSVLGKIKNLQIERISKLYAIGEVKKEEKDELLELLKERVEEREDLGDSVIEDIRELLYENIEEMDIMKFLIEVIETKLSESTKTALLRILKYKLEESSLANKYIILQQLENRYGETRARQTGIPEDNLLRNESIEILKQDEEKRNQLHDIQEFLRAKDLKGMKIVIGTLPEEFQTTNEALKESLYRRNKAISEEERQMYDNKSIIELSKEFVDNLAQNSEILEKMNAQVVKDSKKHKCKTNGYVADHIKFSIKGKKEQTFELQVKSIFVEEIAIGEGSAAHNRRPGKRRVLPNISYGINFIKELQYVLPKYESIEEKDGKYVIHKFSLLENTMSFFQKQLIPNTKEYKTVENIILEYENQREIII